MRVFAKLSRVVAFSIALALFTFGAALADEGVHWAYEGAKGPENWGSLSPDFATCSTGTAQSPIDIPADAPLNPENIAFSYQPSALNILNNGHTAQVEYDQGSAIVLDGITYNLAQFHFHAASEHAIGGNHAPLEIHFVHKSADGNLAVVGVLLREGAENPAYAPVFQNLPAQAGPVATVAGASVDADALLPTQRSYWRYNGSLTTPPCSEGVKWLVMNTPVELSSAQIAAFTAIFTNNERPVQPLLSRSFLITTALPVTGAPLTMEGDLMALALLLLVGGALFTAVGWRGRPADV
jgi:carbonic anhydrase